MVSEQTYLAAAGELLPALYKLAYSLLRSDADAQDAVQTALLKAWEKRASAKEEHFKGFLSRIVINECRNIQRQRMRVFPAETPPVPGQAPEDNRALYEAIWALPDILRLPVVLKYLQDYSEREAASALGVPVTTFKNRLHRARKALRKTLDREVTFE